MSNGGNQLQNGERQTAELIELVKGGDAEAFAALYSRYFDRVYGYLRVMLKDRHEAEDVAQEVFVKALEALPRYEARGQPFRAWLLRVAHNAGIDALRKKGRLQPEEAEQINRRRRERNDEPSPKDLSVLNWISDQDLLIFIDRLSGPQRQVLALRFLFDFTAAEVGDVLGRSAEDVRVLQHRALRFLEQRLAAVGRGPERRERSRMRGALRHAPVLRRRRFALTA